MKRIRVYYLLIILSTSCKGLPVQNSIAGEYVKREKDYVYHLKLKQDKTFALMQKYQHANPQCQGKWSFVAKDTLLLSCNPINNIIETISNGYMPNRENKVIILNQRKLKIGRVVLTRIKKNP